MITWRNGESYQVCLMKFFRKNRVVFIIGFYDLGVVNETVGNKKFQTA